MTFISPVLPEQVGRREVFTTDIIYRLMLGNHDQIVTVSDATKRDLARCYPSSAHRVTTVHSAATVSPRLGEAATPEIEGRYVLAVGNATPNKNFKVLAQAMAMLHEAFPDVALVHVGSDPSETIATTLATSPATIPGASESKPRLIRLSGIDDERLARLYRSATCLCVPSLYEGFCLPVLEARRLALSGGLRRSLGDAGSRGQGRADLRCRKSTHAGGHAAVAVVEGGTSRAARAKRPGKFAAVFLGQGGASV